MNYVQRSILGMVPKSSTSKLLNSKLLDYDDEDDEDYDDEDYEDYDDEDDEDYDDEDDEDYDDEDELEKNNFKKSTKSTKVRKTVLNNSSTKNNLKSLKSSKSNTNYHKYKASSSSIKNSKKIINDAIEQGEKEKSERKIEREIARKQALKDREARRKRKYEIGDILPDGTKITCTHYSPSKFVNFSRLILFILIYFIVWMGLFSIVYFMRQSGNDTLRELSTLVGVIEGIILFFSTFSICDWFGERYVNVQPMDDYFFIG